MTEDDGCEWADWALRSCAPLAMEAIGDLAVANQLRTAPRIIDQVSAVLAIQHAQTVPIGHENRERDSANDFAVRCYTLAICAAGYVSDLLPDRARSVSIDAAERALQAGVEDPALAAVAAGGVRRPPPVGR